MIGEELNQQSTPVYDKPKEEEKDCSTRKIYIVIILIER